MVPRSFIGRELEWLLFCCASAVSIVLIFVFTVFLLFTCTTSWECDVFCLFVLVLLLSGSLS